MLPRWSCGVAVISPPRRPPGRTMSVGPGDRSHGPARGRSMPAPRDTDISLSPRGDRACKRSIHIDNRAEPGCGGPALMQREVIAMKRIRVAGTGRTAGVIAASVLMVGVAAVSPAAADPPDVTMYPDYGITY